MRIARNAGASDAGTRRVNEDSILVPGRLPIIAVADGMGGAGAGDVASQMAITALKTASTDLRGCLDNVASEESTQNRLALSKQVDALFNEVNREIRSEAAILGMPGMGTTLTMAVLAGSSAFIAHVGDSRAYLLRDGGLLRLTEDHTIAELHLRRGRITREQFQAQDEKVLYQVLGAGSEVDVDVAEVPLLGGDILLLTTDGLVRALAEEEVGDLIDPEDLEGSTKQLVREAKAAGAPDNLGLVMIRVEKERGDADLTGLTATMRRCFLFRPLSEPERLVIAPFLEHRTFADGEVIIREGEEGDSFYVIIGGKVRVSRGKVHLTDLRAGKHFGELSLTRPVARSATVEAVGPVRCLQLTRTHFQDIVSYKPDLGARMALALLDTVGDRLRDLSERLADVEMAARGELRRRRR